MREWMRAYQGGTPVTPSAPMGTSGTPASFMAPPGGYGPLPTDFSPPAGTFPPGWWTGSGFGIKTCQSSILFLKMD